MIDTLVRQIERLTRSDAFEIVVAVAVLLAWWFATRVRRALRLLEGEDPSGPKEPRPRRRLPLF